jgi:endonuclease YncB( thermonuclease family)
MRHLGSSLAAREISSKDLAEKAKGLESQAFVSQWFTKPGEVLVHTTKEEKYGRMLAYCYRAGEPSLCSDLLERGLATSYPPPEPSAPEPSGDSSGEPHGHRLSGPCQHPGPLLAAR